MLRSALLLHLLGLSLAGGGAAALPGLAGRGASNATANITRDSYFYGDSPPVYPSPNMTGIGDWASAYSRAVALVGAMTLEERVSLTAGVSLDNGCSGNIPNVSRLNFPGLCLSDAGNGLRNTDFVSSWPSGIHVGASWNRALTLARAVGMGAEFKKKGVNVLLGPVVGPIGRTVRSGRYWEGISVDPYLAGALVYETVTGVQQSGVITSTKHYIGNEQETNRNPSGDVAAVSSNIDDRTMHELYLWPFQDAVYAGSGNIMCSYNRVNNSYGCGNSKTLNGLLKTELGFQGFVVSDWEAQHGGYSTALAGLDMVMPSSTLWGDNLTLAVQNGTVAESRVTDMAVRIVAAWYQMGQDRDFPVPGSGMPASLLAPHTPVDGRNPNDRGTLLQGAVEGHVLLKNAGNALPLQRPRLLSVYGYSARAPDQNVAGVGFSTWALGGESTLGFNAFLSDTGTPAIAGNGTIFSGGGSGATSQTTVRAPFDALVQQAEADGTQLFWDFLSADPDVHGASDACLVLGNVWATEGADRPSLYDNYTDTLIANVAGQCSNTIVVLHNAGTRIVDAWIDHANVTALLFAHLPGEYSGTALVDLLYGRANPSGKLPYTVARRTADYGDVVDPALPEGAFGLFPQADFAEGVFLDYRHFDASGIEPRFPFGFGLSYTTFAFGGLTVAPAAAGSGAFARYPTGAVVPGGQADLWDVVATVTATVTNTGGVAGAEVAQLYVTLPGAGASSNSSSAIPVRQLRGFEKPFLSPGQTATVAFRLTRRDLSTWDVVAQKWLLAAGTYTVSVGASSRDLPLAGTFTLE